MDQPSYVPHQEAAVELVRRREFPAAANAFANAASAARKDGREAHAAYFEGEAHLLSGRVAQALEALRRASDADLGPLVRPARFALGNALHLAGYDSLAVDAYKESLAVTGEDPPEHMLMFRLANVLLGAERLFEAAAQFERAYYTPDSPSNLKCTAATTLGELHHRFGAHDRSIAWFDRAAAEPSFEADALFHYTRGNSYLDGGQRGRAAEAYMAALKLTDDDPLMRARTLHNLGVCAAKAGDLTSALKRFEEALDTQGYEPVKGAWRVLGQVALDAGRPAAAVRCFNAALGDRAPTQHGSRILKAGGGREEEQLATKLAARCDVELPGGVKRDRERTISRPRTR